MPSVTTSPSATPCNKCKIPLEAEALKCSRCSVWMHLRCSDLPTYMLLRYKTSQAQYICRGCVLGEGDPESLEEARGKIEATMLAEEIVIERTAKDQGMEDFSLLTLDPSKAKIKSTESQSGAEVNNSSTVEDVDSRNSPITSNTKQTTCKFFLRRGCKHGRKGDGCKFEHPKLCFKYVKHGDKRSGCKEGKECTYVHPKLCSSYRSGTCSRDKCGLYHIRGTKFRSPEEQITARAELSTNNERAPRVTNNNRQQYLQHKRALQVQPLAACEMRSRPDDNYSSPPCPVEPRDFLEIKSQLKSIQEQLQLLLIGRPPPLDRALPRASVWGHQ